MPLSLHGYSDIKHKTELARHRALGRAMRSGESPMTIFRALILRSTYFKYSDPKLSRMFRADASWVRSKVRD